MPTPYLIAGSLFISLLSSTSYSMSDTPEVAEPAQPIITSKIVAEANTASIMDMTNVTATHETAPYAGSHLAIWQGMNHEWKRFIVDSKNGRIPHRISKLENYISQEPAANQLTFHMGENTGVDGNYMYPQSQAAVLDVSQISAQLGQVNLNWRDTVSNDSIPQAKNRIQYSLEIPNLEWQAGASSVFLQGMSLETYCAEQVNEDTCNSDGMWPHLYHIEIDNCQPSSIQGTRCDLNINIYRSWTPNYGGFQLIGEVKPINRQLDFDLTVHYAGISGDLNNIAASNITTVKHDHELQAFDSNPQTVSLTGASNSNSSSPSSYSSGVAAITGLGFVLTQPEDINAGWKMLGSDVNQRGRYIARKQFEVNNLNDGQGYDATKSVQDVAINMNLWAPTTVVESNVTTEMNLQLLELSTASNAQKSVEGRICINSKDSAPFFSKWKKCDKQTKAAINKFGGIEKASDHISTNITQ